VRREFDLALAGDAARLVRSDGVEHDLAVHRWRDVAGGEDTWLLDRCTGPVIDLGCGPGRLVTALLARGLPALGVDVSRVAQRACSRRGAPMVRRDVFAALPGEGRWHHALLADGNIGIGGDPGLLVRRAAQLVQPGGTVLVETDPQPDVLWSGTAVVRARSRTGAPVPWAVAGAAALARIAADAGMRATASYRGRRSFVELTVGQRAVPTPTPTPTAIPQGGGRVPVPTGAASVRTGSRGSGSPR
jgi:SAM-dependent methyltransferase